jgi:hypothetical protein
LAPTTIAAGRRSYNHKERGIGMRNRLIRAGVATTAIMLVALPGAAQSQEQPARPERVADQPNFNGVWRALNSANWNLEGHAASALNDFWQLGAIGAIPAGQSVVEDGAIPYLPEAVAQRDANRAGWPAADPETLCYLPGIPRATYMPHAFQIVQGGGDILFVYEYASANRLVAMVEHKEPPVDTWMGQSNGSWEGDTLVIETYGFNGRAWLDRSGNYLSPAAVVTERLTLTSPDHIDYSATINDPATFSAPWTIRMPLYRMIEASAQILEFKCVPFVEELLYKDLELPENSAQ